MATPGKKLVKHPVVRDGKPHTQGYWHNPPPAPPATKPPAVAGSFTTLTTKKQSSATQTAFVYCPTCGEDTALSINGVCQECGERGHISTYPSSSKTPHGTIVYCDVYDDPRAVEIGGRCQLCGYYHHRSSL